MAKIGREIGRLGQNRWGGNFFEEFLPELRGRKAIAVYREMADNDDIVGAMLYAIEMLIRQAPWEVQAQGDAKADQEAAEFIESCMNDMQDTWTDTISEILSFLIYGWSAHEIVYKRRLGKRKEPWRSSRYDDGLIGWQKLPIRSQETLHEWAYDENDNLIGMVQTAPPDYAMITIPAEKLLLFRTKSRKNNPEGRSILRNAYRDWYFKRRIQEIEGIGIERDLAGFPLLTAPENVNIWDTDDPEMQAILANAEDIVRNIRRDSMEGLVLPDGWKFELVSTGGKRQFDTNAIIERYDNRIAMTTLADFVLMGHQDVGSFALSSDKTRIFSMAVCAYLDIICEQFNNHAIPALIDMNGGAFRGLEEYPQLVHGDIEQPDIEKVGKFITDLTGAGVIIPDASLNNLARTLLGLPEQDGEDNFMPELRDAEDEA